MFVRITVLQPDPPAACGMDVADGAVDRIRVQRRAVAAVPKVLFVLRE